jgi:hypothetical protein
MKRVTGIGGIFFKANDPDKLREWYRTHLGIEAEKEGGAMFKVKSIHRAGNFTRSGLHFLPIRVTLRQARNNSWSIFKWRIWMNYSRS